MKKTGKLLERLVQLIEMSISPGSSVEHNVHLPILHSRSGATAQCDIVIRTGKPPRETVSIVEVQDRKSKVKPNEFRGWQQKLQHVGAQHLICVSRQPFPASIKEIAKLSGGTIRLITLRALDTDSIPLDLFNVHIEYHHFEVPTVHGLQITVPKSEVQKIMAKDQSLSCDCLGLNDRVFSLDRSNLVSVFLLCRDQYTRPDGCTSGKGKLIFECDKKPALYYHFDDHVIRIRLEYEFDWTYELVQIPIAMLVYEQDDAGALAWVVESSYDSPKGRIALKIPVSKVQDGYSIPGILAKLPPDTTLEMEFLRNRDGNA